MEKPSTSKKRKSSAFSIESWGMLEPKVVHFDITRTECGGSAVIMMVSLEPEVIGDSKVDRCFSLPLGIRHDTPQEAFEWIETVGRYLLPCGYDARVFLLSRGEKLLEWMIGDLDDEEEEAS